MFKNKPRLVTPLIPNILCPKILILVSSLNFSTDFTMSPIMVCVSSLTKKKVKPENSSVGNHLIFCNQLASYDDISIPTCENKTFLLQLKESQLAIIDQPSLNRDITSPQLYLFEKP